jgi:hypothetical protein
MKTLTLHTTRGTLSWTSPDGVETFFGNPFAQ